MLRVGAQLMGLFAAALLQTQMCCAQAPADDPSTLHVYVNLVQIPVLVLNQSLHLTPRIPDREFNITIEGAGRIHPARIRMQGDDPINLALIVDRSVQDDSIWGDLPKALGPLMAALQPQDNLSVFAMDGCKAKRIGPEMTPFDASWLQLTAKTVTDMRPYKRDKHHANECPKPLGYWDMVSYAASRLSQYPGRKLIVTLGPGATLDMNSAARIHGLLTDSSITLFPIVHASFGRSSILPYAGARQLRSGSQAQDMAMVNPGVDGDAAVDMDRQAELSGGLLLSTTERGFAKTLAQPILLARGRYIIEFPRPDSLPPGQHHMLVTDGHPRDFIRPAGISVPIADAKEKRNLTDNTMPPTDSATSGGSNDASTSHGTEPSAGTPEKPVTPATNSTAPASVAPVPAVATTHVIATPPERDPTDITGDLLPDHETRNPQ